MKAQLIINLYDIVKPVQGESVQLWVLTFKNSERSHINNNPPQDLRKRKEEPE